MTKKEVCSLISFLPLFPPSSLPLPSLSPSIPLSINLFRQPKKSVSRFSLFEDTISCVLWEGRHYVSGTDIVRCVSWLFKLDGEAIPEQKKFEEGIFSDLRNLKPGVGAVLEEPRSKFLEFLFKNGCIRTHKKQKVFFWGAVNVSPSLPSLHSHRHVIETDRS